MKQTLHFLAAMTSVLFALCVFPATSLAADGDITGQASSAESAPAVPGDGGGGVSVPTVRIVGHVPPSPMSVAKDGTEVVMDLMRLFVQFRKSATDPMPPEGFQPLAENLELGTVSGCAVVQRIGPFGGEKGLGDGVTSILVIDLSAGMVGYWHVIFKAAQEAINRMGPDDVIGIAFFADSVDFSGLYSKGDKAQLEDWLKTRYDAKVVEYSKERGQLGYKQFKAKYRNESTGVAWWRKFLLNQSFEIGHTYLFNALYFDVFPALSKSDNKTTDLRVLVVLSDMVDECTGKPSPKALPADTEPSSDNSCATPEDVIAKAKELRVPIFAVGFRDVATDSELGEMDRDRNESALSTFGQISEATHGEMILTVFFDNMEFMLNEIARGLRMLYVVDYYLCNVLEDKEQFPEFILSVSYKDKNGSFDMESVGYDIPWTEVLAKKDCEKDCGRPMPKGCCETGANCQGGLVCRLPDKSATPTEKLPEECAELGLKKICAPKPDPCKGVETPCGETCENGVLSVKECDPAAADTGCGRKCKCVRVLAAGEDSTPVCQKVPSCGKGLEYDFLLSPPGCREPRCGEGYPDCGAGRECRDDKQSVKRCFPKTCPACQVLDKESGECKAATCAVDSGKGCGNNCTCEPDEPDSNVGHCVEIQDQVPACKHFEVLDKDGKTCVPKPCDPDSEDASICGDKSECKKKKDGSWRCAPKEPCPWPIFLALGAFVLLIAGRIIWSRRGRRQRPVPQSPVRPDGPRPPRAGAPGR